MGERQKAVDLSKLSPEQRAAFLKFYRDCRSFAEKREELQRTAHAVFNEFIRAPKWGIAEAPHPEPPKQDLWHVGAPEVNFVDKIERAL